VLYPSGREVMNSCALAARAAASTSSMLASGLPYLQQQTIRAGYGQVCVACSLQLATPVVMCLLLVLRRRQPCDVFSTPGNALFSTTTHLNRQQGNPINHLLTDTCYSAYLMLSRTLMLKRRGSWDTRPI
jgi:hypothetical protein